MTRLGGRSFPADGPWLWNMLPVLSMFGGQLYALYASVEGTIQTISENVHVWLPGPWCPVSEQ